MSTAPATVPSAETTGNHRTLSQPIRLGILAASVVLGAAIVTLLFGWNVLAVVLVSALIYSVAIYSASAVVEGHRHAVDRLVTAIVTTAFLLAMIPLVSVILTIVQNGWHRLDGKFFSYSMEGVGAKETGGAYHAIMGTLIVTALATLISVPIGLFAAIYLVEYGNKNALSRGLTFFVDVMTGIPSIVAGLFAYSLFLAIAGPRYQSGIIGAVALSVLMTPVVVRGVEEMLKLVPNELREAAYALGVPKWKTIVGVVLRTAIGGITTSVMIAIARVIGETAPLLITVGLPLKTNFDPLDGSMATLPVLVYDQYSRGDASAMERAWAGALTLIIIVMLLNLLARLISKYFSPKGGRS